MSRIRKPTWLATLLALLTALAASGLAAWLAPLTAASASAQGGRQAVPSYVPMWATLEAGNGSAKADTGPAAGTAPVSARVYLAGQNPRGLAAYAAAVSDPRSPFFHHYLTPEQASRWFGPAAEQVAAMTAWLTGTGLTITSVTQHYVAVTGSVTQAEAAFGATWDSFTSEDGPQIEQSPPPTAQVTVPASVASAVLTVAPVETELPTTPRPGRQAVAPPLSLCSQYYGQDLATSQPEAYGQPAPYAVCGYTPQQMRSGYGIPAGLTGQGVTVAVVHQSAYPTAAQDLATYAAQHGQPLHPGQFTQILPPDLNTSCPSGNIIQVGHASAVNEEDLDIEAVHAMAPEANITYLGADCNDDFGTLSVLDDLTQITDNDLASIVTDASGVPVAAPGVVAAYEQIYEQGATEGIGFYAPSGDYGDNAQLNDGHPMPPSYPASDPWVTAVGGTTLAIGPNGDYQWEAGWGNDDAVLAPGGGSWTDPAHCSQAAPPGCFTAGSGGGASPQFTQPAYQRGVVPASLSESAGSSMPLRVIPDIAADADPATGLVIGVTEGQPATYTEFPGGGTSISAPEIAGIQADLQQADQTPIGFANPAIYARYATSAFNDVTDQPLGPGVTPDSVLVEGAQGTVLETFGLDQGLTATTGYDDVTGVGTPAPAYFTPRPTQ